MSALRFNLLLCFIEGALFSVCGPLFPTGVSSEIAFLRILPVPFYSSIVRWRCSPCLDRVGHDGCGKMNPKECVNEEGHTPFAAALPPPVSSAEGGR